MANVYNLTATDSAGNTVALGTLTTVDPIQPPVYTGFSPTSIPSNTPGVVVTVTGTNLVVGPATLNISGGYSAQGQITTPTQGTFTLPALP